jgi:hypothetical protein
MTNFDAIANDYGNLATLYFFPGSLDGTPFEEATAVNFWLQFTRGLEFATPGSMQQLMGQPQNTRVGSELVETGQSVIEVDLIDDAAPGTFSRETQEVYGDRLTNLQSGWLDFLKEASVRVGGRPRSVVVGGHVATLIARARVSDFGQPRFWTDLNESREYLQGVACLAASYAVNRGFAAPLDVPFFRRCSA